MLFMGEHLFSKKNKKGPAIESLAGLPATEWMADLSANASMARPYFDTEIGFEKPGKNPLELSRRVQGKHDLGGADLD